MAGKRCFRNLWVIDQYCGEGREKGISLIVETPLVGTRVAHELIKLMTTSSKSEVIISDKDTEFTSKAILTGGIEQKD